MNYAEKIRYLFKYRISMIIDNKEDALIFAI